MPIEDFEADLKGNLYKIWNRMSSGSYFPPPVLAVEIPKPHGGGTRTLGVPTVADRSSRASRTSVSTTWSTRHERRPPRTLRATSSCITIGDASIQRSATGRHTRSATST